MAQEPAARLDVTATSLEGRTLTSSVAVLDAAGNPVVGLAPQDFQAQLDGVPVPIGAVASGTNAGLPLGLVLAVDTSGSMAGGAMDSAKESLVLLVGALGPGDQVALLTFAQAVSTPVPATADRAALSAGIDAMRAAGNTALFAGVSQAAASASALPQPRKAVVVLSDGEDFGNASGGLTREQALAAAKASGAPFFVVGLGIEVDQQFLTALARESGGQYFAAANAVELAQLYARISDRLRQQYTITLELPTSVQDGEHRVTFSARQATGQAGFVLASTASPTTAVFAGLPTELRETTLVRLEGLAPGSALRFEVDGVELKPEADGRSVRLNPYALDPTQPHTLTARPGAGSTPVIESKFMVAALPPRLIEPTSLPNLRPGDLVRLSIEAQPGTTTVRYLIDGREVERDSAEPFEFVLPESEYEPGSHTLSVELSNGSETSTRTYEFPGPSEGGRNIAALLLLLLLAAALLVASFFGGWKALAALRQRSTATAAPTDIRELEAWVQGSPREGLPPRSPAGAVEQPPTSRFWGRLRVLEGPDAGKVFDLSEESELIGRGRHSTVRLSDRDLEESHCLVSRDGSITASTPTAEVLIDGVRIRRADVAPGARVRAGNTEFQVDLVVE